MGEVGYAYDALNGGFKYDMASRVNLTNDYKALIDLSRIIKIRFTSIHK